MINTMKNDDCSHDLINLHGVLIHVQEQLIEIFRDSLTCNLDNNLNTTLRIKDLIQTLEQHT